VDVKGGPNELLGNQNKLLCLNACAVFAYAFCAFELRMPLLYLVQCAHLLSLLLSHYERPLRYTSVAP
jgi:hypothetical protein